MKKSYRGQYTISKEEWQIDYSDLATDPYVTVIKATVLNQALREHPGTTESDWEIEYKIQEPHDKPITLIIVECTMKSHISSAIQITLNKPAQNKLTPQQARALAALWEKWRDGSTRIAYSPWNAPYIKIERRDDAPELGEWCITYYSNPTSLFGSIHPKYDDQDVRIVWYSDSEEPMPAEVRNFLRKAWDKEFASIHQTNL